MLHSVRFQTSFSIGIAGFHQMHFKQVLALDSSNVEAIACLASHYFYTDQVRAPLARPDRSIAVSGPCC